MSIENNNNTSGQFVWHDLMSTDHESALKFYQVLFGWDLEMVNMGEAIGNYRMLKSGDDMLGGVIPMDAAEGHASHWISYITVGDVDRACEQMKKLGGNVPYAPFDIPNIGRTAVAQDPTGAYFSPYKGLSEEDSHPVAPRAGTFAWHELMSTDVTKATSFYASVMNWQLDSMDMGEMGDYWLFKADNNNVAGAIQMPAAAGSEATSSWMPYVGVENVPESAKKARSLGGTIHVPPRKVSEPANVHFAVLAGPDGSMFGIVEV